MTHTDLSEREEFLATEIVDGAYKGIKNWGRVYYRKSMKPAFIVSWI